MKTFENPITEITYVNEFSETMHLVMDQEFNIWFHHNDCNETYENFKEMGFTIELPDLSKKTKPLVKYNGFKYVLDNAERETLVSFIKNCRDIAKTHQKTIELNWWDKLSYSK